MNNHQTVYSPIFLFIFLFLVGYAGSSGATPANESSLTLSDPATKQVIHLAQASSGEEKKKILAKEEEEEEPDCD